LNRRLRPAAGKMTANFDTARSSYTTALDRTEINA
jgi:hypothetical protein